MTKPAPADRRFSVYAMHVGSHHTRMLEATSFEAAAVTYLDVFHAALADDRYIGVLVRDLETGHEHCFRIDLDSYAAAPCS